MTAMDPRRIFFDATVLSNFAITDSVPILIDLFSAPCTTETVQNELEQGYSEGYDHLSNALDYLSSFSEATNAEISVVGTLDESLHDSGLLTRLDRGEATIVYHGKIHGWTIATDDLDARAVASEYDVPVTGSIGIIAEAVIDDVITVSTADEYLDEWRAWGYYSPVDSVSELTDESE